MDCPVCFNAASSDETVRASLNMGILVLMGVTVGVLAGFLRFMLAIVRRSGADLKVRPYDYRNESVRRSDADLKVRPYDYRDESRRRSDAYVEAGLQARLPI